MFDIATRPAPAGASSSVYGVPFDWRLTPPAATSAYPWTDYATDTGSPELHASVLATYALALEDTLQTAIILSLFTDARAGDDEVVPRGVTDRRGWVGDEYVNESFDGAPDSWGSLLWLVLVGKSTDDVLERARFYAQEGLTWLVRDGIASQVTVEASWVTLAGEDRLAIRPQIYKADQIQPVYDVLWGTTIRRGASA